jgi:hypothetical protein
MSLNPALARRAPSDKAGTETAFNSSLSAIWSTRATEVDVRHWTRRRTEFVRLQQSYPPLVTSQEEQTFD